MPMFFIPLTPDDKVAAGTGTPVSARIPRLVSLGNLEIGTCSYVDHKVNLNYKEEQTDLIQRIQVTKPCVNIYVNSIASDNNQAGPVETGTGTQENPFVNLNSVFRDEKIKCLAFNELCCYMINVIVSGYIDYEVRPVTSENWKKRLVLDFAAAEINIRYYMQNDIIRRYGMIASLKGVVVKSIRNISFRSATDISGSLFFYCDDSVFNDINIDFTDVPALCMMTFLQLSARCVIDNCHMSYVKNDAPFIIYKIASAIADTSIASSSVTYTINNGTQNAPSSGMIGIFAGSERIYVENFNVNIDCNIQGILFEYRPFSQCSYSIFHRITADIRIVNDTTLYLPFRHGVAAGCDYSIFTECDFYTHVECPPGYIEVVVVTNSKNSVFENCSAAGYAEAQNNARFCGFYANANSAFLNCSSSPRTCTGTNCNTFICDI